MCPPSPKGEFLAPIPKGELLRHSYRVKGFMFLILLIKELNDEVSDTTEDDSSTTAGTIIIQLIV
jgi:hypothetical protein